ncbi:MAG TPA: hypothetical protein VGN42_27330 [Pirellulales bacterium]|nr:hypothetical protein [Pirellulales bacterium]
MLKHNLLCFAYAALAALLAATFIAQFRANDLPGLQDRPWILRVVVASLVVSVAGWIGVFWFGHRVIERAGVEGLATIGLIAGIQFAISYASTIAGSMLRPLLGPFTIFATGPADEGLPCLLLAVLIVLLPRPGTLMLTYLTLFALNCIFGGSFGLIQLLFVTVSIALGETILALARITTGTSLQEPAAMPPRGVVLRVAVTIGLVNAAPLLVQYCLYQALYRLEFATWFIVAGTLVPGFLYGAIGGAIGARLGYRLRRTAK